MSNRVRPAWRLATILDEIPVTPSVRRIVLDVPGAGTPAPGSHLDVRIPGTEGRSTRSYSIVDDGRHPGAVSIGVRLDPASRGGSRQMHALRRGDRLEVTQPLETFDLAVGRPSYLLLAAGIGITPLVGMARRLRTIGADYRLIHIGRTAEDLPFLDELRADHGERVEPVFTSTGGRPNLDALVAAQPRDTEIYVCGPPGLLAAVQEAWVRDGRARRHLRYETFGGGSEHSDRPFELRVPRHGVAVTVPAESTMIDALSDAGVEVMYDCLRGECGLCLASVLDRGDGVDHRDVFLSERQKNTDEQLCLCVSRAAGASLEIDLP